MQCRVCGRAVADGDRFCTACGAPLTGDTEPVEVDDARSTSPDAAPIRPTSTVDSVTADQPTDQTPTPQVNATDQPADQAPTSTVNAADQAPTSTVDSVTADEPADQAPTPQVNHADQPTDQAPTPQVNAADQPTDQAPTQQVNAADQPTELIAEPPGEQAWGDVDPVWAATGPVPAASGAPATDQLPATEPITEVWSETTSAPVDPAAAQPTAVVTRPVVSSTVEMPMAPIPVQERRRFRFTAVTGLSILGSIVTMIAMFASIVTVSTDDRIVGGDSTPANFRIGSWIPSDLADNLPIAGLIAVSLLMCGGVAAGFGWRGGSGLAAGSGLAIAGLAALTIGLAQIPIDAAYEMASIPTDERFTLTITRDLGYWLQLAAAAIGIVVFFASLNDAFGDHRPGLNPWIAALGALAGVVMAAGPLIPEGLAVFSDNWYVVDGPGEPPAMLLSTRLVQLGLLALTSLVGFLSVRRWGLGVAVGGAMPSLWLAVSTMFEITDHPVGPGFRNPGASDMAVHGVTIIGASALAAFLLLALVAAYDQAQHEW